MSLTSIKYCPDPEQYESTYHPATVEIIPSTREPFLASMVQLELNRLWLHQVYETVPCIKHTIQAPTHTVVTFRVSAAGSLTADGIQLPDHGVLRHRASHSYHEHSSGNLRWGAIALPDEALNSTLCDDRLSRSSLCVSPPLPAFERLSDLHAEAISLAESAPAIIAQAEVARGLEQTLIDATVGCLNAEVPDGGTAQRSHQAIMRRFRQTLDENPDRALYIPEICAAVGVPERTLRLCCQEHLGMAPQRYLVLRRMQLARRALRAAAPGQKSVTDIATRYGFWHFGRFAAHYQALFGEFPSATLNREPG